MRIFRKEELLGQWTNSKIRINFLDDFSMYFYELEYWKNMIEGTYSIFENYLILKYKLNNVLVSKVYKIFEFKNKLTVIDISENIGEKLIFTQTYFEKSLIKQFEFESLNELNIDEIKKLLKIDTLHLNSVKNLKGRKTDYFRHWDNDNRYAITIKNDLLEKVKANRSSVLLSVEKEIKLANLGFYTNLSITEYDDTEYFDVFDERAVYDDYNYNNNWSYDESNWLSDAAGTNDPEVMNDVKWNLD